MDKRRRSGNGRHDMRMSLSTLRSDHLCAMCMRWYWERVHRLNIPCISREMCTCIRYTYGTGTIQYGGGNHLLCVMCLCVKYIPVTM